MNHRHSILSFLLIFLLIMIPLPLTALPAASAATLSDVVPGSWYEDAVRQMETKKILTGYPDGTFRPEKTISAAEYVAVAARQAGLSPVSGQADHWASGLTEAARLAGWYDWDELPPDGSTFDRPLSRQLAVKILMKAFLPDASGDYASQAGKLQDLSDLDGRYYEPVFAAYASGMVKGDADGCFRPKSGLSRAEACTLFQRAAALSQSTDMPQKDTPGGADSSSDQTPEPSLPPAQSADTARGGVSQNGRLQVKGTQLCNENGAPIMLRGMSSHGLQWYGAYAQKTAVKNTGRAGANVFRLAMYTGEGGYLSSPHAMKAQVQAGMEAAAAADMYVIIDWHILSDGDPSAHTKEAAAFFTDMAKMYGSNPAVLFEICNEPNGNITWSENVKPYAETVIAAIRKWAPDSVILVGSPTWSQDLHLAASDPLEGNNLMYTLHFYAGTHGQWLRDRIDSVLSAGLPVFVSEWGTSRADGSGGVYLEESRVWLDFLESRGISWVNWSLCDKNETSAALKPGTSPDKLWATEDLTASGAFVFSRFSS